MAKKRKHGFAIGMVVYALVFLALTGVGLKVFWNFIHAYEQSRPKNTMESYMQSLTVEKMFLQDQALARQLDEKLQTQEECVEFLSQALGEDFSYARKSGASTEASQTYVLRSGSQVLGQVVIRAGEPDSFGFTRWRTAEESFDLSFLLGQSQSITVPGHYQVFANGILLEESYITQTGIPYSALEEFYDDYDILPGQVTYTAPAVLGELTLTVADELGNPVADLSEFDPNRALDNCSEAEREQLQQFMEDFLTSYVRFTSGSNQANTNNYLNLVRQFMIPDSQLAHRLYTALDGLAFAQSYNDKLAQVTVNRISRIGDTHYFCDATYLVNTYGKAGLVQTTNNLKVMLVMWEGGLRVEAMTRY